MVESSNNRRLRYDLVLTEMTKTIAPKARYKLADNYSLKRGWPFIQRHHIAAIRATSPRRPAEPNVLGLTHVDFSESAQSGRLEVLSPEPAGNW